MLPKIFQSSVDSEKLSLTVQGILGAIGTIVLFYATTFGIDITSGDIQNVINSVGKLITGAAGTLSAFAVVYGAVRKLVVAFRKE